LNKTRKLLNNYYEAEQIDSFESLSDAVLVEQFLAAHPTDVRKFMIRNNESRDSSRV